ncbi:MAG: hypothetical protein OHK0039_39110 [Bacteroidia bacterium]
MILLAADQPSLMHRLVPDQPYEEGPIRTLVLDPGHGGRDPGAVGKRNYEKTVTLGVARKIRELSAQHMPEVRVVLTRDKDVFIPLHRRGGIALQHKGQFFISIHCNGSESHSKYGAEAYVLGVNPGQESYATIIAENEAILFEENYEDVYGDINPSSPEGFIYFHLLKDVFRNESTRLARKIQDRLIALGRVDRGVKQAPFVVLYVSGMPAVLMEIGFITNPEEEQYLASDSGQYQIARAVMEAVREYNREFERNR